MNYSERLQVRAYLDKIDRDAATIKALKVALHDAINRPKGVVPESAEPFYDPVRYPVANSEPDPKSQAALYI